MKRMTRDELDDWAADNYRVRQDCEGTAKETLMAGWVNASEMESDGHFTPEIGFVEAAYHDFDNMGYTEQDLD